MLKGQYFVVPNTNFMMYDTREESICLAWAFGNEASFIEFYVHEEIHHVLHKRIDLRSCCEYDNIARQAESESLEVLVYAR
jgi:hypothetical protein